MAYSLPDRLPGKQNGANNTQYETSNMRDYKGLNGIPAQNARPGTSTFYTDTHTGDTKYTDDFAWKTIEREQSTRAGSASGQRKNNPHPLGMFPWFRWL